MKKLVLLGSLLAVASGAFAQGTLVFANLAGGVNAPITNAIGQRIVGPGNFVADLYYSANTSATTDSLVAAGFNQVFSTTTAGGGGGYFLGGTKALAGVTGAIEAQVRVWDITKGATYAAALANGSDWGVSSPIFLTLTVPPASPAAMAGLTSFTLTPGVIPEPTSFALAGLGAAALLIFRRRKN